MDGSDGFGAFKLVDGSLSQFEVIYYVVSKRYFLKLQLLVPNGAFVGDGLAIENAAGHASISIIIRIKPLPHTPNTIRIIFAVL